MNLKGFIGPAISKLYIMESLILAQNERWRRGSPGFKRNAGT